VYTRPNYLINNPTAHDLDAGELNVVLGYGIQVGEGNESSLAAYYTFNEHVQAGLSFLNGSDLNLNVHSQFYKVAFKRIKLNLGGGFLSIPNTGDLEGSKRLSGYMVTKASFYDLVDIHAGLGNRLIQDETMSPYFGVSLQYLDLYPSVEYDGANVNAMLGIEISPYTRVVAGVVGLNDTESQIIHVGLHSKTPLFKEIRKRVDKLEGDIDSLSNERKTVKRKYMSLKQERERGVLQTEFDREEKQRRILRGKVGEYIRKNEYSKAISSLKQSLEFNPNDLEMKLLLANIYYIKDRKSDFEDVMKDIIAEDVFYEGIWELSEEAFALISEDVYKELELNRSYFETISKKTDQYVSTIKHIATQLAESEDYESAVEYQLAAMKQDPFDVNLYLDLAENLNKLGQSDASKAILNEGIELFDGNSAQVAQLKAALK